MLTPENFELDEVTQALIDFYANPADNRTKQQLADELKVDISTIMRREKKWHKQIFDLANKKRKEFMPNLVSMGYKALSNQIAKKSPKALELLFKLTGELVERVEQTTKYETVDQKREKLGELLGKFGIKLMVDQNGSQLTNKPSDTLQAPSALSNGNNSL